MDSVNKNIEGMLLNAIKIDIAMQLSKKKDDVKVTLKTE